MSLEDDIQIYPMAFMFRQSNPKNKFLSKIIAFGAECFSPYQKRKSSSLARTWNEINVLIGASLFIPSTVEVEGIKFATHRSTSLRHPKVYIFLIVLKFYDYLVMPVRPSVVITTESSIIKRRLAWD